MVGCGGGSILRRQRSIGCVFVPAGFDGRLQWFGNPSALEMDGGGLEDMLSSVQEETVCMTTITTSCLTA